MNEYWRRRPRDVAGRPRWQSNVASLGTVILTLAAGALLTLTTGLAAMVELEQFGPSVGGIVVSSKSSRSLYRMRNPTTEIGLAHVISSTP